MAKTDKELAVELAGKIVEAAFDKEKVPDSRNFYFLQLNAEKIARIVKASYDAIHALPKDAESTEWV